MSKPIIKWVGGKTQIIDKIFEYFPKKINNYYEPFVGGGSVLLKLLDKIESDEIILSGSIYITDVNHKLINLYNCIKNDCKNLILYLQNITKNYENANDIEYDARHKFIFEENVDISTVIAMGKKGVYYYYRNMFNSPIKDNTMLSALFIFLNKTGFRGLYRENNSGEFNVPYGNYKNPSIYDSEQLYKLNYLFVKYDVVFECKDFYYIMQVKSQNNFVYIDPPYYPIDDNSFVKYNKNGFNDEQHKRLYKLCKYISSSGSYFLHSNSKCEHNTKMYDNFKIDEILCKRSINSKKPGSKEMEILIFNYGTKFQPVRSLLSTHYN